MTRWSSRLPSLYGSLAGHPVVGPLFPPPHFLHPLAAAQCRSNSEILLPERCVISTQCGPSLLQGSRLNRSAPYRVSDLGFRAPDHLPRLCLNQPQTPEHTTTHPPKTPCCAPRLAANLSAVTFLPPRLPSSSLKSHDSFWRTNLAQSARFPAKSLGYVVVGPDLRDFARRLPPDFSHPERNGGEAGCAHHWGPGLPGPIPRSTHP